jgi:hypothetical protein
VEKGIGILIGAKKRFIGNSGFELDAVEMAKPGGFMVRSYDPESDRWMTLEVGGELFEHSEITPGLPNRKKLGFGR